MSTQRELHALRQKYEVEKARRKSLHNALVVSVGCCLCAVSSILQCSRGKIAFGWFINAGAPRQYSCPLSCATCSLF